MLHSQSVENCNDKLILVRDVISALLRETPLIRGSCIKHVLQLGPITARFQHQPGS
jgi:hypothetical protein